MESGKTNLDIENYSPHTLAREGIEPFHVEAKDKGVTVINGVPEDLPDVPADLVRIRHVFANLISNSLRFTKPGGVITVRAEREDGSIRFSVEDTGEGIPPEHLPRLFDQFYRVPGQDEKSGVGLGLAIVKEIVQAHGGTVGASSEAGKGSAFEFTLPLEQRSTETRGHTA
jgi:signal transduction histidine kinase